MHVSIPKNVDCFSVPFTLSRCFVTASHSADLAAFRTIRVISTLSANTILSTREAAR